MSEIIHRIETTQLKDGVDVSVAQWDGRTFSVASRNGTTMALARQLIQAGAPDAGFEVWGRPQGKMLFYGHSLYRLAQWAIAETGRGLRMCRFPAAGEPLDGFDVPPGSEMPPDAQPASTVAG